MSIDQSIEAIARRDRLLSIAALAAVSSLAWIWLWLMEREMNAAPSIAPDGLEPLALSLTFVMWVVMMAGMMLPSAAPAILLYASLARAHRSRGSALPPVWLFSSGYLVAWTAFSAVATIAQGVLEHTGFLDATMTSTNAWLSGGLLVAAGIYQSSPLKLACLGKCATPLEFFMTRWRDGPLGAFRMGMFHGTFCVGCCWALMALLFVAGVMNLAWIALLTALVLVEKTWPIPALSRAAGAVLAAIGLWLIVA